MHSHCMDLTTPLSFQDREQGRRVSCWGPALVLMDDDGEASAQPAGEQVGEGDKDGETGPWRERLLWDGHNRALRGRATLLPTGPALGVLEFGGLIPRSTRERSWLGWTPPLAWARDARTHARARGTEAAEWWCVGMCGVSGRGFVANSLDTWL